MVILGGAGSQAGVVIGAVLVSVLLEMLRDAGDDVRALFYVVIILALAAFFRASTKLAVVLGGTIVFGLLARVVAGEIDSSWTAGPVDGTGRVAGWASDWVIVPTHMAGWVAPVAYVGLVALALALTLVHGWTRIASWCRRSTSRPSSGRTCCCRTRSRRATSCSGRSSWRR